MSKRIGLVGARGFVGSELIRLIAAHPSFELAFVSSRERAGQLLSDYEPEAPAGLRYVSFGPQEAVGSDADALVLALPNGMAAGFAEAVDANAPSRILLDLSADFRFDEHWAYGLPELNRDQVQGKTRISNPGCYATAMQLAIAPMVDVLDGPPQCFGVSGYSGAGTTASEKNNPETLRDNLIPYSLVNHIHEREVTRHLRLPVEFMPHVAPHFRGITMTVNLHLSQAFTRAEIIARYRQRYAGEKLMRIVEEAPWVSRIAGKHHVEIGGFTVSADGRRLVVVATLDNLLKGAATQAMQNLNLAFGLPELAGIDP